MVVARLDEDLSQVAANVVSGNLTVQKAALDGLGVVLERALVARLAMTTAGAVATLLEGGMGQGRLLAGGDLRLDDGQVIHPQDVIKIFITSI